MKRLVAAAIASLAFVSCRTASARQSCIEVSDVVGEQKCSRYGDTWSIEGGFPLVISIGGLSGSTTLLGRTMSVADRKKGPTVFSYDSRLLGGNLTRTYGLDVQVRGLLTPFAYVGFDMAGLGGKITHAPFVSETWRVAEGSGVNVSQVRALAIVGGRLPLGRITLRAELAVGIDQLGLTHTGVPSDPPMNGAVGTPTASTLYAKSTAVVLEPRIAFDLWTTPWTTVSAWAGTNALRPHEHAMGLAFAFHLRSFDGAFSF